jgi:hypothetical protein
LPFADIAIIDLSLVEGLDRDGGNLGKSRDKHRVAQAEAEQVFINKIAANKRDAPHRSLIKVRLEEKLKAE